MNWHHYALHDRGSIIPNYYLCVPHAEALLMANNTSYLNIYRDASAFSYCIRALFIIYKQLSLCPISGVKAAPCFVLISRSNLLWLSLFIKDLA
jgi:hypothetical protein